MKNIKTGVKRNIYIAFMNYFFLLGSLINNFNFNSFIYFNKLPLNFLNLGEINSRKEI